MGFICIMVTYRFYHIYSFYSVYNIYNIYLGLFSALISIRSSNWSY